MDIVERIDKFQSTSSVRRETAKHEQMLDEWVISIHCIKSALTVTTAFDVLNFACLRIASEAQSKE